MKAMAENHANVPAFLGKLWQMVNDPTTNHLISWNVLGDSFIIPNQTLFWRNLLPTYYKHNNMSSFIRQLNMYGFHKVTSVESGAMDQEREELQFHHPLFQKDQPLLLNQIKRKVAVARRPETSSLTAVIKKEDLANVLLEVNQLRRRQASVDVMLTALKQENATLWAELAIFRQKHNKQRHIVNKLIHFLLTLAQSQSPERRGSPRVKRRGPLMLHESPSKKTRVDNDTNNGPTIHELDAEVAAQHGHLEHEDTVPLVSSPQSPKASSSGLSAARESQQVINILEEVARDSNYFDQPEYIDVVDVSGKTLERQVHKKKYSEEALPKTPPDMADVAISFLEEHGITLSQTSEDLHTPPEDVLTTLMEGAYNAGVLSKSSPFKKEDLLDTSGSSDLTVASRDGNSFKNSTLVGGNVCYRTDFKDHVEGTQNELETFKDILDGYNSLDASALLGLFSDEAPSYSLSCIKENSTDPMVSGAELTTLPHSPELDFNDLIECTLEDDVNDVVSVNFEQENAATVNTPMFQKAEPKFPKPQ